MKKVLFFDSYTHLRWHIFHDSVNETIAVDTITFISDSEDAATYQLYKANVWIKYEVKTPINKDPFKMSLENVEIQFKFAHNDMGMSGEYRILEFYGYNWDDQGNYHTKFDNPTWESVVPDSSKETNLINIVKYDLKRRKKV